MRQIISFFCLFLLASTSVYAKPSVYFALVSADQKNATSLCTYQTVKQKGDCKKTLVNKSAVFQATDLRYAEYQEKARINVSNGYNRLSTMIPGQNMMDINFTLAFKPESVKKINRTLKSAKNKSLAIVIDDTVFLTFAAPINIKNNTVTFKKKMDILLARHITKSIALARQ